MSLHLAPTVDVPLDLATESNALLGKKGSGKTNALIVLIEEMHAAGVPVVSIDPKGDHWGIRAGANGKAGQGLPIPVFGGLHGDIPLEPTAGAVIARLIRDRNLSVVLDVSEFSASERRFFLTNLATGLYKHPSREPMHLVLEEAHEYIPQRVDAGDTAMVGAFEKLVKLGRYKGLGVTMASQRSASLNKNVLTQVDNLVMLRMLSPQDRTAVRAWIDTHADPGSIIDTLPSLQTGEAWLWQPERGDPIRFRFRQRRTFDAGATPKPGEKPRTPATLADIDLREVQTLMADTIEKAKADDPKELRRRIAELTKENDRLIDEADADLPITEVSVEVKPAWLDDALGEVLIKLGDGLNSLAEAQTMLRDVADRVDGLPGPIDDTPNLRSTVTKPRVTFDVTTLTDHATAVVDRYRRDREMSGDLTKQQSTLLAVLAQFPSLSGKQLAMRSGYSFKSSAFSPAITALRDRGLLTGDTRNLTITNAGRALAGDAGELPAGRALIDHWVSRLKPMEGRLLIAIINAHPHHITYDALAEATGYSLTSSAFSPAVTALKSFDLVHGDRASGLVADDTLGEAKAR